MSGLSQTSSSNMMGQLRLRHPEGAATLDVDFHNATMQDLQQQIFAVSGIRPEQQRILSGYPSEPLAMIPGKLLSDIGLRHGDQVLVRQGGTSSSPTTPRRHLAPSTQAPVVQNDGPACVEMSSGMLLVHRDVPDDNSCLFSAIALIFRQDIAHAQLMRTIVAREIQADPETYSEAILGMPRDRYIGAILKPSTWGGAIELGILAKYFETEIASLDVETGRIDQFFPPPNRSGGNRCLVIYSGIHYDVASVSPAVDATPEWDQTIFPIMSTDDSDPHLEAAQRLATVLRERRAFTNTTTFDLRCEQCGKGLKGEKDARKHAQETGHVRFGEY